MKVEWTYRAFNKFKTGDIIEVLSRRRCPKCNNQQEAVKACSKYLYRLKGDPKEICSFAVKVIGNYELDEILGV